MGSVKPVEGNAKEYTDGALVYYMKDTICWFDFAWELFFIIANVLS